MTTEMTAPTSEYLADLNMIVRIPDRIIKDDNDNWEIQLDQCRQAPVSVPVANSLIQGMTVNALLARYVSSETCLADRIRMHSKALTGQQGIIDTVCEMFWQEARDRGWCDEAQAFMEELSARLNVAGFDVTVDTGEKDWIVEWDETWTVRRSATVRARDAEHAREVALDEHVGESDISDLQYESWTYEDCGTLDVNEG